MEHSIWLSRSNLLWIFWNTDSVTECILVSYFHEWRWTTPAHQHQPFPPFHDGCGRRFMYLQAHCADMRRHAQTCADCFWVIVFGLVCWGKFTGNHRFSYEIWVFPVDFPLNQSIESWFDDVWFCSIVQQKSVDPTVFFLGGNPGPSSTLGHPNYRPPDSEQMLDSSAVGGDWNHAILWLSTWVCRGW